jgi:uncharacterized membrane protein
VARKNKSAKKWPVIAVEVAGLLLSIYLALISFGILFNNVPCPRGSLFACHSIVKGRYSTFAGLPIAPLGVAYFALQLMLSGLYTKKGATRWLKLVVLAAGVAFAGYLRAVELRYVRAICPWCWGVALLVLLELYLYLPVLSPPIPRTRYGARAGIVFAALIFCIAISAALMPAAKAGSNASAEAADHPTLVSQNPPATPVTVKRQASPTPSTSSLPKPKPAQEAAATRTPVATPAPEVNGQATGEPDTEETRILRARGWTMVYSSDAIISAIQSRPPVLLLAFNPECPECKALINDELSQPRVDALRVTRVAIDEARLTGLISDQVKNVPTLLLFDANGKAQFKCEGRIRAAKLVSEIQKITGR